MGFGQEILAMIKSAQESKPEKRTTCPICEWPLEEKDGILHCPLGHWSTRV